MTTATTAPTALTAPQVRFTYVDDPSGRELRRALMLPASADRHPPLAGTRPEPAALFLTAVATLTLLAGVLRVALA